MNQESIQTQRYSILASVCWLLFLSLGVQIIIGIIAGLILGITGVESSDIGNELESPIVLGIITLLSASAVYLMLPRTVKQVNRSEIWRFLGFKKLEKSMTIKVLVLGGICYSLMSLVLFLLDIPTPQFMLDLKANTDSLVAGIMVFGAVCVIAPVLEEVIFRGVGFARLINSRARVVGAILIPSLLFVLIHLQYEIVDMLTILPLALLLGYLRYKTDNICYCILLHFQVNLLSMVLLFTIG